MTPVKPDHGSPGHAGELPFERVHRKLMKCLYLYLAETAHCGIGVFAARQFGEGEVIIRDLDHDYYQDTLTFEAMAARGYDIVGVSSQVGDDAYVLPNGTIDDFMNHSCQPNTGLRLLPEGYEVIALSEIAPHNEIRYDYSTYLAGSRETFRCLCGAKRCRGVVGDFVDLPQDVQRYYLQWGVVGRFALP